MLKNIVVDGEVIEHYFADTEGNIYNKEMHKMTGFKSHNGYIRVKLSVGLPRRMYLVHRLIAETFVENPNKYPIVDHKNNQRDDNRLENLQWCNNSFNQKKRFENRLGTKARAVAQVSIDTGEIIEVFPSAIVAYRKLGIANQNIYKVCAGRRNSAGGFCWKYID